MDTDASSRSARRATTTPASSRSARRATITPASSRSARRATNTPASSRSARRATRTPISRSGRYRRTPNFCTHCGPIFDSFVFEADPFDTCSSVFEADPFGTCPSRTTTVDCLTVLQESRSCFICFRIVIALARHLQFEGPVARYSWKPSDCLELTEVILRAFGQTLSLTWHYTNEIYLSVCIAVSDSSKGSYLEAKFWKRTKPAFPHDEDAWKRFVTSVDPAAAAKNEFCDGLDLQHAQLGQIREWLEQCLNGHVTCGHLVEQKDTTTQCSSRPDNNSKDTYGSLQPTRLIEVGKIAGHTRLVLTSAADMPYRYATLSHCWGHEPFQTLTRDNYSELLEYIGPTLLSRTFSESIILCRGLDIQYIWIDSLCIIQDDENDYVAELSSMDQIYSNAIVNFCATSSQDGTQGLCRPHNPLTTCFTVTGLDIPSFHSSLDGNDELQFDRSPIFNRGWILQEMALSPRTVHFTDVAMILQCRETVFAAGSQHFGWLRGLDYKPNFFGLSTVVALDEAWENICDNFVRTQVTHAQDRVAALAPLAALFARCYAALNCNTVYMAGCWVHSLFGWLAWQPHVPRKAPEPVDSSYAAIVPSWSWLSVTDAISFGFNWRLDRKNMIVPESQDSKLIATMSMPRMISEGDNPLDHGHLLVEALWSEAETLVTSFNPKSCFYLNKNIRDDEYLEVYWDTKFDDCNPLFEPSKVVLLLLSSRIYRPVFRGLACRISERKIDQEKTEESAVVVERCGTFYYAQNTLAKCWRPKGRFWLI